MFHRSLILAAGLTATLLGTLPSRAAVVITVDKSAQEMSVTVDGAVLRTWRVSTGRLGHDTPNGTFRALSMDASHFSKEWDNAPMPHSIFFTGMGHAIHGSSAVSRMGMPASHGCVRLEPKNATELFALVTKEGMRNTTIVVTGDATVARARVPAARAAAPAATTGTASATKSQPVPSYQLDRAALPEAQPPVRQALATQLAEPPVAPTGYPPFPRPAFGGVR